MPMGNRQHGAMAAAVDDCLPGPETRSSTSSLTTSTRSPVWEIWRPDHGARLEVKRPSELCRPHTSDAETTTSRPKKLLDSPLHLVQDGRGGGVLGSRRETRHRTGPKDPAPRLILSRAQRQTRCRRPVRRHPQAPTEKRRAFARAPISVSSTRPPSITFWTTQT